MTTIVKGASHSGFGQLRILTNVFIMGHQFTDRCSGIREDFGSIHADRVLRPNGSIVHFMEAYRPFNVDKG